MSCHLGILGRKERTKIMYHGHIIWVLEPVHALMISEYLHCIKCQRRRSNNLWEDVQFSDRGDSTDISAKYSLDTSEG